MGDIDLIAEGEEEVVVPSMKTQVGLGNCDNTADNVKNVLSATKWTNARNFTIGKTTKSVNGASNISWTLAEIGSADIEAVKKLISDATASVSATLINNLHPVGSVKITFTNVNPGTTLPGTTWALISQGKYIRGVDPDNAALNTAKTGGSNVIDISHSHYVEAHTHELWHTHTIAAHTHTIAHAHSINGHSHTVNSHAHSTGGLAITASQMPAHSHTAVQGNVGNHTHIVRMRGGAWIGDDGVPGHNGERIGTSVYTLTTKNAVESSGGHNHNVSIGNTGGGTAHAHGNTGASAPGTNAVALTTNSGGGNSGGTALTTASGGGTTTGTAMDTNTGGGTRNIEPEYQTLYFWQRTK